MSLPDTVIVVPTIREKNIVDFLARWKFDELPNVQVIIVEDNPTKTFGFGEHTAHNLRHLCHADIDREMGDRAWIIPRRTDCVRSFGYYKAWQLKPGMIITLDDDCYPHENMTAEQFIQAHWNALFKSGVDHAWESTLLNAAPRGIPYMNQYRAGECVLNHGLWSNVLDWDAPTTLANLRAASPPIEYRRITVPIGKYFPMCGMNLAFIPNAVPALYFLLMGAGYPYDRFGDIWAGVIFKRIADYLGYIVKSGDPLIEHQRASNVWANLRKEANGLEINERFWQAVDDVRLEASSFAEAYRQIAQSLPGLMGMDNAYFQTLSRAMLDWTHLFESEGV